MLLIGIHGKKKSGKDTLADELITQLYLREGVISKKIAFADHLKSVCASLFCIPLSWFYEEDKKEVVHPEVGLSPRRIMVGMSEALRPRFGDDLFIAPVRRRWNYLKSLLTLDVKVLIVTDVRGEHEAEWVRAEGGIVVHIHRNQYKDLGEEISHWSEAGIVKHENDIVLTIPEGLEHVEQSVISLILMLKSLDKL